MPKFGRRSKKALGTCHEDLQRIFSEVIKEFDCAVICGHRGRADQEKAFRAGFSKLQWPKSKHNKTPSFAVDVVPWPSLYKDENEFYKLAGVVDATARRLGIRVKWGGTWRWKDLPHWQLEP